MKTIKVKFVGFWPEFKPDDFFLTKIMKKYYDVVITEDADYVICSGFGFYDYLGQEQVRIFFSGENYIPDFNYVDYAISVYPIQFLDRHFSFPGLVLSSYDFLQELSQKKRDYSPEILQDKPCFANMIASHESEKNLRGDFLKVLGQYRRIESAGSYLNNMPRGETVRMRDGSKFTLQKKCKFTFCGESIAHEGFVTEKIFDAFLADTIPIYYGSSTISEIINKKAYIDLRDFDSLQQAAERIIELDTDDDQYMDMLRQPVFVNETFVEEKIADLELFVCSIFDQPLERAYRRSRQFMPARYEKQLLYGKTLQNKFYHVAPRLVKNWAETAMWGVQDWMIAAKKRLKKPKIKE